MATNTTKYYLFISFLCLSLLSNGQLYQIPVNQQIAFDLEEYIYDSTPAHTAIKPYVLTQPNNTVFWQHAKQEKKYRVFPVFSSNNFAGDNLISYTKFGLAGRYTPNEKWHLQSSLEYGMFAFSPTTQAFVDSTGYLPNHARYEQNYNDFYALALFNLKIAYQPFPFLTLSVGKDKHFFGDGYRSLFLSDNAASFPFGNIEMNVWKLKYSVLYSFFKDFEYPDFNASFAKYNTIHFLSYAVSKRFNINIFESVSWSSRDSVNHRGYDINYLNPIIFFRPVEFSLDDPSPDNVLMGLGFRYKFYKNYHLYGQVFIDDFLLSEFKSSNGYWANKQGFQLGLRFFDLLGVDHLFFISEVNLVRPFTYAHLSNLSNYGHQNEPLAHPLGSNFLENINYLRYHKGKLIAEAKWIYAKFAEDTNSTSLGNNIYKPYVLRSDDYGHKQFQGELHEVFKQHYKLSYALWQKYDLFVFAGFQLRHEIQPKMKTHSFINFGVSTYFNFYDPDFTKRH